jgi:hypothetical protein
MTYIHSTSYIVYNTHYLHTYTHTFTHTHTHTPSLTHTHTFTHTHTHTFTHIHTHTHTPSHTFTHTHTHTHREILFQNTTSSPYFFLSFDQVGVCYMLYKTHTHMCLLYAIPYIPYISYISYIPSIPSIHNTTSSPYFFLSFDQVVCAIKPIPI